VKAVDSQKQDSHSSNSSGSNVQLKQPLQPPVESSVEKLQPVGGAHDQLQLDHKQVQHFPVKMSCRIRKCG